MKLDLKMPKIGAEVLTDLFNKIKLIYDCESVDKERKDYILGEVQKYGYLPYPHIRALEELTPAETVIGVEEKFRLNKVYKDNVFNFNKDEISPVKRAGFVDSSWCKTEQHNIKLINLAGLGDGNNVSEPGKFIDWLKQLLILPSGNVEKGILSTTAYLIPFHPREFGCAYLPASSEVSKNLEDSELLAKLNLNATQQVQLFLILTQLAGHPIMYDVLPQTARFSKTIIANPHVARWFDINELIVKLTEDLFRICSKLKSEYSSDDLNFVRAVLAERLIGIDKEVPENLKELESKIEKRLNQSKKFYSNEMMRRVNQNKLHKVVKQVINARIGVSSDVDLTEEDIQNHAEVIDELINSGLWPAPGGGWNSSGVPVFDKMNAIGGYPVFKHYDFKDEDVTAFANLDCQTPYYFCCLESGEYNHDVIDFYVEFLKKLQADYNFDGFRVDHVDHIVDEVSEIDGSPISYRAPRSVLERVNTELKKIVPHFATLAEYMLWDNFYKEYHQDMNFDLLWGNDIISQFAKTPCQIVKDNEFLAEYNAELESNLSKLSILKTYNNQDGEFNVIDQYPGQLGEAGALFKWFKFKFLPGGKLAQRPVLFIDGDESFTTVGIESVVGSEQSMKREKNYEFFRKFDALNRFALNNELTRKGIAEVNYVSHEETGLISWSIKNEKNDSERLFVVANEKHPTEKNMQKNGNGDSNLDVILGKPVFNKTAEIPEGFKVVSEYVLEAESLNYTEKAVQAEDNKLFFKRLHPSEFHIYKISRFN